MVFLVFKLDGTILPTLFLLCISLETSAHISANEAQGVTAQNIHRISDVTNWRTSDVWTYKVETEGK